MFLLCYPLLYVHMVKRLSSSSLVCACVYIYMHWKFPPLCFSDISVADFSQTTSQMTVKSYTHTQEGKKPTKRLSVASSAMWDTAGQPWQIPPCLAYQESVFSTGISAWASLLLFSHSVVSSCLQPYGLQPARLLCSWDSPGKNTGVDCHFLL